MQSFMLKYLLGLINNIFNKAVSFFALIDSKSIINKKAKIYYSAQIFDSSINSYSYIGPRSHIVFANIGKFCSIASDCYIGLPSHSLNHISTSPIFTTKKNGTGSSWTSLNTFEEHHRVILGNDVWIGTRAIIMSGLKIGNGAIIGAGAIVTKDIPDYAIAVGVPAKVIRYRFDKPIIEKLLEIKWWNMPDKELKMNIGIFQTENFRLIDLNNL